MNRQNYFIIIGSKDSGQVVGDLGGNNMNQRKSAKCEERKERNRSKHQNRI